MNVPVSEYLNAQQAADYLFIKRSTLYKMIQINAIPYFRPTGTNRGMVVFLKSDLDAHLNRHRVLSRREMEQQAETILNGRA